MTGRDFTAQCEAERTYREAYERLCELAQTQKATMPLNYRGTSNKAVIALRAYRSVSRPLEPIVPTPECPCLLCEAYAAVPSHMKLVPLVEAML